MSENCCVDSMPLLDRTSYFRKPNTIHFDFGFGRVQHFIGFIAFVFFEGGERLIVAMVVERIIYKYIW